MNAAKIGVGVIVVKDGKVLLGKRESGIGSGTWAFTGGKLEFNETIENCAKRETMEEAGVKIGNIKKIGFVETFFKEENKHYITLYVKADYISGEPIAKEPEKCKEWRWYYWKDMPRPLFLPIQQLIDSGYSLSQS